MLVFFRNSSLNVSPTFQVKDAANAAYDAASPKVAEGAEFVKDKAADGAEYLKDKAGQAYDALKPKVSEGAEYLQDKAGDAYEAGSKNLFVIIFLSS